MSRPVRVPDMQPAPDPVGPTATSRDGQTPARDVPCLDRAALHGLAGDVVDAIGEVSEAHPAALLFHFLAMFGAMVGRGPHYVADGADHHARLHVAIVGDTAKARKGSALAQVRRIAGRVDKKFCDEQIVAGFGSGEAIVDEVRDPRTVTNRKGEKEVLPGAEDKRLLVVEPELARLLVVAGRDGSTIAHILRSAWDGDRLAVRSRANPAIATDAHVVVIGHITEEELRLRLADADVWGGTANRFLWVHAHRTRRLPHGAALEERVAGDLVRRWRHALDQARRVGRMSWQPDAAVRWVELYDELADDDPPGLLGAAVARAEAQVLRLAVHYALLDGIGTIALEHLDAGHAAWRYARATADRLFAGRVGDRIADRLLDALRAAGTDGLTGREQHAALGGHVPAGRLDAARRVLESCGLVVTRTVASGGRPAATSWAVEHAPVDVP